MYEFTSKNDIINESTYYPIYVPRELFESIIAGGMVKPVPASDSAHNAETIELLTIQQCREIVKGPSYYKIRSMILNGELKAERAGNKPRGKFLVYKSSLLECFNDAA